MSQKPRHPRDPFVGPLGGWELLRLARRGQATRARLMVLYLLLLAFILTPILWFPHADPVQLFVGTGQSVSRSDAAAFGNRFTLVLLQSLLFAVAAMTPGYAATSIAEEKERDTLQLLLTTPLSDREIVLGKGAGRLGFVLAAAAAGLPVLVVMTLFGGVDIRFLLAGCALIASTTVLATAIGLHAACATPDLRGALVRAYGVAVVVICGAFLPPMVLFTPFAALIYLEGSTELYRLVIVGLAYPAIQLIAAAMFLADAVERLRGSERAITKPPRPRPVADPEPPVAKPEEWQHWADAPSRSTGAAWWVPDLPPIDEANPLLWKERHVTGRKVGPDSGATGQLLLWGFGLLGVLLILSGGMGLLTNEKRTVNDIEGNARQLMSGGTLATGVFLVPVAIGLAATVTRERHRKTLDALLSLPVDRPAILRAKVWAVLEWRLLWLPVIVLAAGWSFGAPGGWRPGLAAAAFVLAGSALVVGLGTFLTVRCATEVRAMRLLIPAVVMVVGVPLLAWNETDWYARPRNCVAPLAAGAAVLGAAAVLLWWRAVREFNRIG